MILYRFKAQVLWNEKDSRSQVLTHCIAARNFDSAKEAFEEEWVPFYGSPSKTVLRIDILEVVVLQDYITIARAAAQEVMATAAKEAESEAIVWLKKISRLAIECAWDDQVSIDVLQDAAYKIQDKYNPNPDEERP